MCVLCTEPNGHAGQLKSYVTATLESDGSSAAVGAMCGGRPSPDEALSQLASDQPKSGVNHIDGGVGSATSSSLISGV